MRILFIFYLLLYFPFSVHTCAAKDELPSWIFQNQEGLYLGVSEVMDDAGLALLQAQARAVLNFCLTEGLPFETVTNSEINFDGKEEDTQRHETTQLELSGFECSLEKLYAHPSGEYFVLCRVKQSKSNNKILFSRKVDSKSHSITYSCCINSHITATLDHNSYSENITYNKNNSKEEIGVKIGEKILPAKQNYRYAEYAPSTGEEKAALTLSYKLQHSFGRVWIGVLTQIPLCNKEVTVKRASSLSTTSEKEIDVSKMNSLSTITGNAEGLPFPLYCAGITKGQLIIKAGYSIVEEMEEYLTATAITEKTNDFSACSDALVNALIDAAVQHNFYISSIVHHLARESQSDNKEFGIITKSNSNNTLKIIRNGWLQEPSRISCVCSFPIPKLNKAKEVQP